MTSPSKQTIMDQKIVEDQSFTCIAPDELRSTARAFEGCRFLNCDLSYADLSQLLFVDCTFESCNLSLGKVLKTGFQDVTFLDCKITGVNFSVCNDFSLSLNFSRCILDYSVFHGKKLKGIRFSDCSFEEADFTEADLTKAVFDQCNLSRTIFNRTILKGADFTGARNFSIDPEINHLAKAKFRADSLSGLLDKHDLVIKP